MDDSDNDDISDGPLRAATQRRLRITKMSLNRLDELPPELCAMVVDYLDLPDIRSLRLVSRALEHNTTQDRFRSFFKLKHVDMSREGLEKFGWMACNSELGRLLESLTLTGIVYDTAYLKRLVEAGVCLEKARGCGDAFKPDSKVCSVQDVAKAAQDHDVLERQQADHSDFHRTGRSAVFLTEALQHLAAHNRHGLQKLTISVTVYQHGPTTRSSPSEVKCWELVHEEAKRTFALAMTAIICSGTLLRSLDMFCATSSWCGYGLPRDALTFFCDKNLRMHDFSALRRLSICITDECQIELPHNNRYLMESAQSDPSAPSHYSALGMAEQIAGASSSASKFTTMLETCPVLEVLELSTYRYTFLDGISKNARNAALHEYIYRLARMKPLQHLRRLRLAGLEVRQKDITRLLKSHAYSLRKLEMYCVNFNHGIIDRFFSCIAGPMCSLESIALLDLFDRRRLVLFGPEKHRKCTLILGDWLDCNKIERWGADIKKVIPYRLIDGVDLEEIYSNAEDWKNRNRQEFGDFEGWYPH